MAELWLVKGSDNVLHAAGEQDEEYLKRFKIGVHFKAEVRMKRNGKHHRLGMALLQEVFKNQDRYDTFEAFMIEVKILTGYVDTHISLDGTVSFTTKSIAFDSMDELDFGKWKNDALTVVFRHFIPGMDPRDQERVINNLIARM